jgi:hypothetical protein
MIWALVLYGLALLLGLAAYALSALVPAAEHAAAATRERWVPGLGPGWLLRMDGTAEYRPRWWGATASAPSGGRMPEYGRPGGEPW